MPSPSPPPPFHLLRSHHAPLSSVHFNPSNTLLYSGDQDGFISILDLRVRRVIAYWKAHQGGILGLEEWQGGLISHGRDNVIHFYEPVKKPYIPMTGGGGTTKPLETVKSLPTNTLNFCRFSLTSLPAPSSSPDEDQEDNKSKGKEKEKEALLAVPSLMDSELVDIYHLPSLRRIHASVNLLPKPPSPPSNSGIPDSTRSGLAMSLHVRYLHSTSQVSLSIGYEDGRVELFICALQSISQQYDPRLSKIPNPWKLMWKGKGHNEAIMGMDVDTQGKFGWTVSADHRLVRYDFDRVIRQRIKVDDDSIMKDHATKQVGNSAVAVNADGKLVAVGGWDGKIRLFSAESFKPLGTLSSHRETIHTLSFANLPVQSNVPDIEEASTLDIGIEDDSEEEDERIDMDGIPPKERWLASGGKDTKVALWGLMDFARGK
ncbi:uncharacterized protein IL334_005075 [Kwoniella shivajii]|uniref:ASTRA-associated protein 1 n=1 Tax=Kwoniella shivajii TaxID=564305 RepID=A0ABZ1D2I2_9TREE|nr:hypothetical protein IL334_005075 [Kwoniella shivajii]